MFNFNSHQPPTDVNPFLKKALLDSMHPREMHGGSVPEAPDVTRVISAHSSAYLLPTNEEQTEFLLVDTGMDKKVRNIHDTLRNIHPDIGLAAVKAVFITHGHIDHARGVGAFPDADVYASEYDAPYLLGEKPSEGKMKFKLPKDARAHAEQIRPVAQGDEVTVGNRTVRAYEVPGHTSGSMAYVVDDVLFIGDGAYFQDEAHHGETGLPPEQMAWDVPQAERSVGTLIANLERDGVQIRTVLPAHSGAGDMDSLRAFAAKHAE